MKIVKTFILIAVIGLLLDVVPTMTVSASTKNVVGMIVITEDGGKCVQAQMTEEQIAAIKKNINDFEGWLEQNDPLTDLKLDESETSQIRQYIDKIIKSLPEDLQFITAEEIIELITPVVDNGPWWMNLFVRHLVMSTGSSGYSWIPLTQYEWGVGTLPAVRIRTFYATLGGMKKGGTTTFVRVIPPDVGSEKFSGRHIVSVRSLTGLYLNIGDIGWDGKLFGQVVLIGRAYVSAIQL